MLMSIKTDKLKRELDYGLNVILPVTTLAIIGQPPSKHIAKKDGS